MDSMDSTQNSRALPPDVLQEMMADVRRRLLAAQSAKAEKEAAAAAASGSATSASSSSSSSSGKPATTTASLRETESQLFRVFQLFDPKNTKAIPTAELLLLLRAVAIDLDESLLTEVMKESFPESVRQQITAAGKINFDQFVVIVKNAGSTSSSKQEARRVYEMVLPKGDPALNYDAFRKALAEADARITDGELSEIFRYCSLSGNPNGMILKDWEDVADFVAATH